MLRSRYEEWELWSVLSLMCREIVSTNRSLGCQPAIRSRRIFSSDPSIFGEGVQRKKYLVNKMREMKIVQIKYKNSLTGSGS